MTNTLDNSVRQYVAYLLLLCPALLFPACSQTDYGPTGTVCGTLLYDGKTVAPGTMVVFKNLTTGHACTGETDAQGHYRLDSWNRGELPVGTYSVMIQPPQPVDPETIDPEVLIDNPQLMESVELKFDFPEKYGQIATSGLSFEVKAGTNEFPIELVD